MRTRLFLIVATLVAFGASLVSSFHFDDYAIFSDPVLTSADGWRELWSLHQTRPLTYLTFWINYQIGGGDALGYHLINLLLHVGAALLAFDCLSRLLPGHAAVLAATIYAIHPLQAEAVNYVWARSIVLASLLCFASLREWLQDRPWRAVIWFLLALLAKEEVAAFPLVLILLGPVSRAPRRAPLAAMLALSLAAGVRVIYATRVVPGAPAGFQAGITPWDYLVAQGLAIFRYLRLLIVPYGFTVDPDVRVPAIWLGVLAWLAVLGALAALFRYAGRDVAKYFAAGLILLIPSSSIFPAADLAVDRRMYLPMLAFAAAAGLLLTRVKPRSIVAIVFVALTGLSFARTIVWMSDEALWTEAVRRSPDKVRPKVQLARSVRAGRALELLSQARELAPNDPSVAAEIGKTLLDEGQPDAALTEFGRALALDPRDARSYNNRGVALQQLGQTEAARADFRRALEIDPYLNEARENLRKLPGQ